MIKEDSTIYRSLTKAVYIADLVVVGGGLAGVCGAITAARQGLKVILVQDRPVLGGNSSSEVRLWILGATSHMGNNNRWAREGGVINEILIENMYRNPEGNGVIFDTILLDKVVSEPNITLLLNTSVYEVAKSDADTISAVIAFCSQNQMQYELRAPLFCDASGDGIVGFLAGAAFRMGAESSEEFGEKFAPSAEYGELLGHTLYFYSKDTGKPVRYVPPAYALDDITRIPRYRSFNAQEFGCKLWWIEYGGRLDTVHETETIKWELWKVVYGVWNYIKNSGKFPEAENLTLEWVGQIPGKRESRRFEGDYLVRQQDIVEQRTHTDAVAFGGWSIDLHPADGVFSEKPGCNQWHSKGIYQIPYRSLYSRNISNLFLAGRLISVSHVAFGSTRVMATGAYISQAMAVAARFCKDHQLLPRDIFEKGYIHQVQQELQKTGQHIPGHALHDPLDLTQQATVTASSEWVLNEFPASEISKKLLVAEAQMLPLSAGKVPVMVVQAYAETETLLEVKLRVSEKIGNFTPEITLGELQFRLRPGAQHIELDFGCSISEAQYVFVCFGKNPGVSLTFSDKRVTGVLTVFNSINEAVSNYGKQTPAEEIGIDEFEFWCPQRRPDGQNLAMTITPGIACFPAANIQNGVSRPTHQPNAWVASPEDPNPALTLSWSEPQAIREVIIKFDADFDHPMESVLIHHPETVMPFCVQDYQVLDDSGKVIFVKKGNYQTLNHLRFEQPVRTRSLVIHASHPSGEVPAAIFEVLCYA